MTRRREPVVLCWTPAEAAEALRMSEHLMRELIDCGHVRTVTWNRHRFVPARELDRLIDDALANGGTLPASAAPASPLVPAGRGEVGTGDAGPRDTGSLGEVRPTVGSSANRRPASPTTRTAPTVAAVGASTTAG